MISHPLRCIYVHIPKTGGNSVNAALGSGWEAHKDLARFAAELRPEVFNGYFKFAIVRNPWERLFSDYNYQRRKSRPAHTKLFLFTEQGERRRFRDWVAAALARPHAYDPSEWGGAVSPRIHRWSPQVDWIEVDGRIAVDAVARMERLQADFRAIAGALGLGRDRLPRRNRRLHYHYSWYYDEETRLRVAGYYARDISAFGYRFESSPGRDAWLRAESRSLALLGWALTRSAAAAAP